MRKEDCISKQLPEVEPVYEKVCPMVCVSARLSPLLCVFHLLRCVCMKKMDLDLIPRPPQRGFDR